MKYAARRKATCNSHSSTTLSLRSPIGQTKPGWPRKAQSLLLPASYLGSTLNTTRVLGSDLDPVKASDSLRDCAHPVRLVSPAASVSGLPSAPGAGLKVFRINQLRANKARTSELGVKICRHTASPFESVISTSCVTEYRILNRIQTVSKQYCGFFGRQIRTVLSLDPDASRVPSVENATELTQPR